MSSRQGQINEGINIYGGVVNANQISVGKNSKSVYLESREGDEQSLLEETSCPPGRRTVLFLSSNPKKTAQLRLNEELREIDESLRRSKHREKFSLRNKGAVRPRDFYRAMLEYEPQIVHFSGHGKESFQSDYASSDAKIRSTEGILFENELGEPNPVSGKQLADVFELFSNQIECVLLNACYSDIQAESIAKKIPYVIGMEQSVTDRAAIEFAVAFYDSLASGRDIDFSFKLACTQLIPWNEQDVPCLLKRAK